MLRISVIVAGLSLLWAWSAGRAGQMPIGPAPAGPTKIDPYNSTIKTTIPGWSCSAVVLHAHRPDGRIVFASAYHCMRPAPGKRSFYLPGVGRTYAVTLAIFRDRDVALFLCERDDLVGVSAARLAPELPRHGAEVYHRGFTTRPKIDPVSGLVDTSRRYPGYIYLRCQASPGDSGGGVYLKATGEVVGVTSKVAAYGTVGPMWAGNLIGLDGHLHKDAPKAVAREDDA